MTTTDRNAAATLAGCLDILTKPHDVEIEDHGRLLGWRRQQALLAKLRHLCVANIGPGNGNRAHHERTTLNTTAVQLYVEIERTIRRWANTAGIPRTGNAWPKAEDVLRAWYAHSYADANSGTLDPRPYAATLTGWINAITDLADPPRRFDINAACPLCGIDRVTLKPDGHHEEIARALTAVERDPAHLSSVTCGNCGAVWHGIEGAEALSALLRTGAIPLQDVDA